MNDETLADGIYLCERLAPTHPGVAALLAILRALRADNERLRAALLEIADNGDFVPLCDIGRRMDIDIAKRALELQP